MRIGIIGGTGKEGSGLAARWALAGHDVAIGSRDAERGTLGARALGETLAAQAQGATTGAITGGDNTWAAGAGEVIVLAVPYTAHDATLRAVAPAVAGKILIDITVPLAPPRVRQVHLPAGQAAALEAQAIVGPGTRVVAALHHISSVHLADPGHDIDCDVLVCGDDEAARATTIALVGDLGMRGIDAGPLVNAIALESLTPVLLYMNQRYKGRGCGIRITGLPQ